MTEKYSSRSSLLPHSNIEHRNDSNHSSEYLSPPPSNNNNIKRRFSATKMLARAKDSLLVNRHSLDSARRSLDEQQEATIMNTQQPSISSPSLLSRQQSSSSLPSIEKAAAAAVSTNQLIDDNVNRTLSSKQKHYSLPLRRPFTIRKDHNKSRNSLDSSLSSFSTSSSGVPNEENSAAESSPSSSLNAAAIAEADIMSGTQRPGSFATACDFRLANEKKNEEFHALFKSVQVSDMLIQDYKCALQKDILLQGHLYVSEHHVCFKSNIFGWVTNLVINFDEITQVEKKMTAKIIPNGITISTSTTKHVFASLLSRDQAYDQIVKIWDLCKRANSVLPSTSLDNDEDNNSFYEEGETDEEDIIPNTDSAVILSPPLLITTEEDTQHHQDKLLIESSKSTPAAALPTNSTSTATTTINNNNSTFAADNALFLKNTPLLATLNRPRAASDSYRERRNITAMEPIRNDATNYKRETLLKREIQPITPIKKTRVCPCTVKREQYTHIALNETYPGTVEAMFKLLYDSDFFKGFLERYENFEDVQLGEWKQGTREVIGKRRIKSSSTMGTKVVKTLFQEKRIHRKYPYYSCVTAKKSMPDMPMGAVYSIQSRTCITRVNKDKVHVLATFQVAFTKSGLVSSIIEKNAADDQLRQFTHLHSILNKPELIRELVHDAQLLQDLGMHDKSKPSAPSQHLQTTASNQDWVSKAMHYTGSIRLVHFIYIGFFFVLLTHCVLALRLQRITHRLDLVQQRKKNGFSQQQEKEVRDAQWITQKMDRVSHTLNQLQGQVQDYDQRILKMKNNVE